MNKVICIAAVASVAVFRGHWPKRKFLTSAGLEDKSLKTYGSEPTKADRNSAEWLR